MNALQNDQNQVVNRPKDSPPAISGAELMRKMRKAKFVGTFGGATDLILRFRNGELVAEDTGDQGAGQN
jgi:hypothetical protein